MKIGAAFPSKYVKASDLPDGQFIPVTIASVVIENVAGDGQAETDKPVLYFSGKEKGLVLNKTNSSEISAAYGDETDDWAGKKILLYAATTPFNGKTVPCIRVKVPKQVAPKAAPKQPVSAAVNAGEYAGESSEAIKEDSIPF
jgi:hypothetical protein